MTDSTKAAQLFAPTMSGLSLLPASIPCSPAVVAFYLPQYHQIPENDEWWGVGFTDWANVAAAHPLYSGHTVPHVPADLGFYDLRRREVREAQAQLARSHGIYGFCYYFYWFGGRRLLEQPLELMLADGEPDLPFCLCWANEPWTRRWDGREGDVLMAQHHDRVRDLGRARRPHALLRRTRATSASTAARSCLIYRQDLLDDPARFAVGSPRGGRTARTSRAVPLQRDVHRGPGAAAAGFDAAVEFPPNGILVTDLDCRGRSGPARPSADGSTTSRPSLHPCWRDRPIPSRTSRA